MLGKKNSILTFSHISGWWDVAVHNFPEEIFTSTFNLLEVKGQTLTGQVSSSCRLGAAAAIGDERWRDCVGLETDRRINSFMKVSFSAVCR